ncbi:hypothetical protein [Paenibacillus sp. LHD-38]|nr:hypothetical protein [Paenibacillus sp. LHD-38]MDQ8735223.1 hypothetical protein [Paenibacillus sp. LHD-38]
MPIAIFVCMVLTMALAVVPTIIAYLAFQEQVMKGMTAGAGG